MEKLCLDTWSPALQTFLFYPLDDSFQALVCGAPVRTGNNPWDRFDSIFLLQIRWCECRKLYGKLSGLEAVCGPQCLENAATDPSSSLFGRPPSHREYVESLPLSSSFLWEASEQRQQKKGPTPLATKQCWENYSDASAFSLTGALI